MLFKSEAVLIPDSSLMQAYSLYHNDVLIKFCSCYFIILMAYIRDIWYFWKVSGGVVPATVHAENLSYPLFLVRTRATTALFWFLLLDGCACPFHLCCAPVVQVQALRAPCQSLPGSTYHKVTGIWLKENYAVKCEGKQ